MACKFKNQKFKCFFNGIIAYDLIFQLCKGIKHLFNILQVKLIFFSSLTNEFSIKFNQKLNID